DDDEPSDDDDDDDDTDDEDEEPIEDEDDDEEKEEHLASADSSVIPVVEPLPSATEALLGYRAVGIRLRASSLSTHHPLYPSPPLPPPPSSLHL
ncbi:hypothetical protein Tco_0579958, partial [Tanacetum coccineum]